MKFNEKLRVLRINNELTQDEVAAKLNISRQSISKWEQGINEPNIDTLKQLCLIFDVSISELIDDDKEVVVSREEKQIRFGKKLHLFNVASLIFLTLITFVIIRAMKDSLPMHYNIQGEVTRYGSKWEFLMFPGLALVFLLSGLFYKVTHSETLTEFRKTVTIVQVMFIIINVAFSVTVLWWGLANAKNLLGDIAKVASGIMLSLFLVLSIFSLPKFNKKRNEMFGLRTRFTLSNDIAWSKVNRFQSISAISLVSLSYLCLVIVFSDWTIYLLGTIIISLIPTLIYHEVLKRKLKHQLVK